MQFYVIGTDGGLLNAPVPTHQLTVGVGERFDLLVDFSALQPGEKIQLLNDEQIVWPGQMLGSKMIPNIMQFTARGDFQDAPGFQRSIPATLRGGPGQPQLLPPLPAPEFVRTATLNWLLDNRRIPFSDMNINNVSYADEPVEMALQGRVEQWDFVNTSPWDHTMHLHLVQFRLLGRQDFRSVSYLLLNRRPKKGTHWAPSAERFKTGRPLDPPLPVENGWKDTVRCPPGQITRILVRFPTAADLGFDPDRIFSADEQGWPLQGYAWHCHIMDHEDHEMMLRYRLIAPDINNI